MTSFCPESIIAKSFSNWLVSIAKVSSRKADAEEVIFRENFRINKSNTIEMTTKMIAQNHNGSTLPGRLTEDMRYIIFEPLVFERMSFDDAMSAINKIAAEAIESAAKPDRSQGFEEVRVIRMTAVQRRIAKTSKISTNPDMAGNNKPVITAVIPATNSVLV
jgi:hypothetical protein